MNKDFKKYISEVYRNVAIGLALTTAVSYLFSLFITNGYLDLNEYPVIIYGSCILEFIVAIVFGLFLNKISKTTAWIMFMVYSFLTGLSLSSIFLFYTMSSIFIAFGAVTVMFILLSYFGYTTDRDLNNFGVAAIIGLALCLIISAVNIFIGNSVIELLLDCAVVIIFVILTAYDSQKIRYYYEMDEDGRYIIFSAFQLYLDFINLLLEILKLFGDSDD